MEMALFIVDSWNSVRSDETCFVHVHRVVFRNDGLCARLSVQRLRLTRRTVRKRKEMLTTRFCFLFYGSQPDLFGCFFGSSSRAILGPGAFYLNPFSYTDLLKTIKMMKNSPIIQFPDENERKFKADFF